MKRAIYLGISLLLAFIPSADAATNNISQDSVTSVELNQSAKAIRIVALANGSAEIVSALGLRSSLVGRDIASSTTELKNVPIVTSGHQVIAEKIIALKPDLVLVDASTGPKTALDTLKSAKIRLAKIPEAWTLSDIDLKIKAIGVAVLSPDRATELIKEFDKAKKAAKDSTGWKPRIAFLYLRGPNSIYLIGGPGSGADSIIASVGGVDVGANTLKHPFNTLTAEALVKANPDVLLVMTKGLASVGGTSGLLRLPGVAQTTAGKKKQILSVDDSLLLSFGPRTPSLIKIIALTLKGMK